MSQNAAETESVDVVYTWVDDSFPGYRELLQTYSGTAEDRSPERTRDNLDLLKYSLRSLRAYVPFVRHIYIVSCSPQVPRWLATDRPGLTVVHHDAFMDRAVLPTFNSFVIVSFLSRIAGLSRRFLYSDDDMLFCRAVSLSDFADEQGRLKLYLRLFATRGGEQRHRDDLSSWSAALAHTNHLLDEAFGRRARPAINHTPLFIDRDYWDEMIQRWEEDFRRTRMSRFRSKYNVVPEHLYPHFLNHTKRARVMPVLRTYRETYLWQLENSLVRWRFQLARFRLLHPKMVALNDDCGERPSPLAVSHVRAFLEESYPEKSPFEI